MKNRAGTPSDGFNGASEGRDAGAGRRAIVCFVDDHRHLIQQTLALRHSWLYSGATDTDLVVMGPEAVLARMPNDLVKIAQRPATDDPAWQNYRYINSIACMNGPGAERLDRYTHLLRTDVDTFITPAWNEFRPAGFTVGEGGYSNSDEVRARIRAVATRLGFSHGGVSSIGSTWYGPTAQVRHACAVSEAAAREILAHEFLDGEGAWPYWYKGVTTLYAGEIAINHCAPDAQRSDLLDSYSTRPDSIMRYPHIHCWHTDQKFSKHWFMSGRYTAEDAENLDLDRIPDYCMAMSFRSLADMTSPAEAPIPNP